MDRVRVVRIHLSQQIQIAEGDCREHMVLRPALDQQIDYVAPRVCKHGRPPDDIQPMEIANAFRVGAGVEECPYRFEWTAPGGKMQRQRVIAFVAGVGIGAALEQQPDGLGMVDSGVEAGRSRVTRPSKARLAREQFTKGGDVSRAAGCKKDVAG